MPPDEWHHHVRAGEDLEEQALTAEHLLRVIEEHLLELDRQAVERLFRRWALTDPEGAAVHRQCLEELRDYARARLAETWALQRESRWGRRN